MIYEFKLPDVGEGVVEGEIVQWLVKPGAMVKEDQPMVEIMTDKATVEIPSPVSGRIEECRGEEGGTVEVGDTLVVITVEAAAESAETASGPETGDQVLATPAVRKLARSVGIKLAKVEGTGPGGRITSDDVERHSESLKAPKKGAREVETDYEALPYRGLRRKIGDHLSLAKRSAVHFTYIEECDATELVRLRERYVESHPDHRMTYLPLILIAVVSGLSRFPLVNAILDEDKGEIQIQKKHNIGIATATSEGLIVPVVKEVEGKSIHELADEITRLTDAARSGKVALEDLKGGTFTVTSLGPLGGLAATPVINFPEVGILGVHKIAKRPVVRDGGIVVRDMMNLSITLDHRVVDGLVAAQFIHHVIRLLETPGLLLLE